MTAYADTSALIKRYLDEPDSDLAEQFLASDPVIVTSWITVVETRRNLARLLTGTNLAAAQAQFAVDLDSFAMVACDELTARAAGDIGEVLGVRSLDAIHLASAQRLHIRNLAFITFDLRQAQAARSLGFVVLGS